MEKPTTRRALSLASIILSGIVLVLAVLGILGAWVGNYFASGLVVDLSVGVEKTAQALQRTVGHANEDVVALRNNVQQVQTAITQLSQNVSDNGLIATLLPDNVTDRIQASTDKLTETLAAVEDTVTSTRELYQSINRLPFVDLPDLSTTGVAEISESVQSLRNDINDLRDGVNRVRQKQAGQIDRVATLVSNVDSRLSNLEDTLARVDKGLGNTQVAAQNVRRVVPPLFTVVTILMTLILIWVIYTQVVVIRLEWQRYQALRAPAPPAVAA